MSYTRILVTLGILVALTPFLGLPYSWLMFALPVLGVLIALFAALLGGRRTPAHDSEKGQ